MARQLVLKVVKPKRNKYLSVVKMKGFINASTLLEFESILDELLLDPKRDVVLDFQNLNYINSSGIAAIINYHHSFKSQDRELVCIRMPRPVAVVVTQLGLTSLVPLLRDEQEALMYLRRGLTGVRQYASYEEFLQEQNRKIGDQIKLPTLPRLPQDRDYHILVVEPSQNDFIDVVKLRFSAGRTKFTTVHSVVDALMVFDKRSPDLVILRDTMEGSEAFLEKVKIQKGRSLVPVIKLYSRKKDVNRFGDFKIWENDFFVEPFDIMELFTLSEAELRRRNNVQESLRHHINFKFRSTDECITRACELGLNVLSQTDLSQDDVASFHSAFKEAVDNARRHGHKNDPRKVISAIINIKKDEVQIQVSDEGPGFDHESFTKNLTSESAYVRARRAKSLGKQGGLGILLMFRCSTKLEYYGKGNVLTLTKKLA